MGAHIATALETAAALVVIFGWPLRQIHHWTRRTDKRLDVLWRMHFKPQQTRHPSTSHVHVLEHGQEARLDA
jgi:hypothetical protein